MTRVSLIDGYPAVHQEGSWLVAGPTGLFRAATRQEARQLLRDLETHQAAS